MQDGKVSLARFVVLQLHLLLLRALYHQTWGYVLEAILIAVVLWWSRKSILSSTPVHSLGIPHFWLPHHCWVIVLFLFPEYQTSPIIGSPSHTSPTIKLVTGQHCLFTSHSHVWLLTKSLQKQAPALNVTQLPLTSDLFSLCICSLSSGYMSPIVYITSKPIFSYQNRNTGLMHWEKVNSNSSISLEHYSSYSDQTLQVLNHCSSQAYTFLIISTILIMDTLNSAEFK